MGSANSYGLADDDDSTTAAANAERRSQPACRVRPSSVPVSSATACLEFIWLVHPSGLLA